MPTLNRGYPTPEPDATPDVTYDLTRLATAVDADVASLLKAAGGALAGSVSSSTRLQVKVGHVAPQTLDGVGRAAVLLFPVPFPNGLVAVFASVTSGIGTQPVINGGYANDRTGFQLIWTASGAAGTTNVAYSWLAVGY